MFLPNTLYTPTALNAAMAASVQKEQSLQRSAAPQDNLLARSVSGFVAHAPTEKKIALYSRVRPGAPNPCWPPRRGEPGRPTGPPAWD